MIDEESYIKAKAVVGMRRNLAIVYPDSEKFWIHDIDRMLVEIYENNRTPNQEPGDIDKIAYAVCPIVKPWMDSEEVRRHPCLKCKDEIIEGEKGYPICLGVCRDVAEAAFGAIRTRESYDKK